MNRPYLLIIAATLVAAPMAFAHTDGGPYGTPKTYCEDIKGDKLYHDYGPSTGFIIFLGNDGSLGPECPYSAGTENPTFDGHYEHAFGGAWLVSGDAAAAAACGWPYPDHPRFPIIWVWDHVLSGIPADVSFSVYSDTLNNIPPVDPNEPNCGDFESDFGADCVNHCTVGFPPGLDQTYQVYVNGGMGHVWTTGPPPAPVCNDGLDNDLDGATDWPADPGCTSATDANELGNRPSGRIGIHRFPDTATVGSRVVDVPNGWTCVDSNTNAPVGIGSTLATPNPGVRCQPPGTENECFSVTAGGAHAGVGTGTVAVTSACSPTPTTTATLTLPGLAGTSNAIGIGPFPWSCTTQETGVSGDMDYWVFCTVNP